MPSEIEKARIKKRRLERKAGEKAYKKYAKERKAKKIITKAEQPSLLKKIKKLKRLNPKLGFGKSGELKILSAKAVKKIGLKIVPKVIPYVGAAISALDQPKAQAGTLPLVEMKKRKAYNIKYRKMARGE